MDDEMGTAEVLKQVTEENQTRKILEILSQCQDLDEAQKKVRALLHE